ncbi:MULTISPECIES: LysE family translocator [unclassified Pseudoxanthomonas]|uniref:LysE family translocator n=1 Tax=unclassified Pseudoxanthomonas TaxID=2645906 RepID=UPI001613872A|nr:MULTISPECIES: LysE family translocator [unclassified Pseudoxanthomonas]MBB3276614.1 threonine/homoserine/homoserine lactone efflux protein [Pseudoxanthomonas sp. OG2]MBD9378679.1 LysE family translocator [Pseudoxanthomonas sp. PXM04]MBV7472310.1 LysE family translocator [Pseudoxanthomonas sp. PXM05]
MDTTTLLLFSATVLPLIATPGPDMLFIVAQTLGGGGGAGLRATFGVCTGYLVHSMLAALGLAALIAASPPLFAMLRWAGVAYLAWLAWRLLRSATRPGGLQVRGDGHQAEFRRGFLTAVLNPKGMMIYFAILPQFISSATPAAPQAIALSATFIGLCAAFYSLLALAMASGGWRNGLDERRRRWIEGVSGGLIAVAAGKLAIG